MTYSVTWTMLAHAQIERIAASRIDRTSIDQATIWMDYTLRRIPFDVGESRSHRAERLWYSDVLGVYYLVDDDALTVRVVSVGPARRR